MGGMVDFGFLERAGSLDPVSQAIERMGERMTAERARKAKMAEESRNADRNFTLAEQRTKAITDREDRMQRGQDAQSEVENSKRRSSTDAQIREDIARGDMAAARQRDADYAEVDPSTQTVKHGRGLEIKDRELGPAPEAPVSLPPGAEGPIPTPQIARHAGVIDMAHGQNSPYAEYAGAMDNRDAEAKLGPTVKLGSVTSSVDEIRNSGRRQAATDFSKVGESLQGEMRQALESGDPYLRDQATRRAERYAQLRAGVESGAIKPFDAMKQLTSGVALDDKYREGKGHDERVGAGAIERQRVANQKPTGGRGKGAPGGGGTVDPKAFSAAESAFQHFEKQWNISGDRTEDANLRGLLANKDKAIVQRAITSNLSRGLAREKGVLTDQDINRLQKNLGGAWTEVENWFSKGATGELSPDVMAKLEEGINTVLQQHETNRRAGKTAFDQTFGPTSPLHKWGLTDHIKNKRAEYFGDEGAAPSSDGGSPGGSSVDDIMAEWKKRKGK